MSWPLWQIKSDVSGFDFFLKPGIQTIGYRPKFIFLKELWETVFETSQDPLVFDLQNALQVGEAELSQAYK